MWRLMADGRRTDHLFNDKPAGERYIKRNNYQIPGVVLEEEPPCDEGAIHSLNDYEEFLCPTCDNIIDCCCHCEDIDSRDDVTVDRLTGEGSDGHNYSVFRGERVGPHRADY